MYCTCLFLIYIFINYLSDFSEIGLESALRCTNALFHGSAESLARLSLQDVTDLFGSAPTKELFLDPGTTVFDTVMKAGCFSREGE